jgi:hypothetical protein
MHKESLELTEEEEKLHHLPDTNLLLWPELGFSTMHD